MDTNAGLKNVQWTYLGVACFVVLLIILFWLAPFPEITDADQEALEGQIDQNENVGPFKKQTNSSLVSGVSSATLERGSPRLDTSSTFAKSLVVTLPPVVSGQSFTLVARDSSLTKYSSRLVGCWAGSLCRYALHCQWPYDDERVQASIHAELISGSLRHFLDSRHDDPWHGLCGHDYSRPEFRVCGYLPA